MYIGCVWDLHLKLLATFCALPEPLPDLHLRPDIAMDNPQAGHFSSKGTREYEPVAIIA